MRFDSIDAKKQALDRLRPLPPESLRNLEAWFRVELTYTSNALEGNTLSRRETAVVLEKGMTVGGKSLKEHLEATNHARALDFVSQLIGRQRVVAEQEKTEKLLAAAQALQSGAPDGAAKYKEAVNCKACHSAHKPD